MTDIKTNYRNFGADLLSELNDIRSNATNLKTTSTNLTTSSSGVDESQKSFLEHVQEGVDNVNAAQKKADVMASDLASGKSKNIHETMLAATHAELSFNLMVAIRNKVLESYQEVMRMQI